MPKDTIHEPTTRLLNDHSKEIIFIIILLKRNHKGMPECIIELQVIPNIIINTNSLVIIIGK